MLKADGSGYFVHENELQLLLEAKQLSRVVAFCLCINSLYSKLCRLKHDHLLKQKSTADYSVKDIKKKTFMRVFNTYRMCLTFSAFQKKCLASSFFFSCRLASHFTLSCQKSTVAPGVFALLAESQRCKQKLRGRKSRNRHEGWMEEEEDEGRQSKSRGEK